MIPKKLIKIPNDMQVDTINKQNKKEFQPLIFGDRSAKIVEKKKEQKELEAKQKPSRRRRNKTRGTEAPSPKKARTSKNKTQEHKPTAQKIHNFHPLMAILRILVERKEQDRARCPVTRLFRIYERRVVSRVEGLCKDLSQLNGLDSELSWVQKSLLPFLNNLAQYYSHISKHGYEKNDFSYADDIGHWLFEQLSNECAQLNWFSLQKVRPYRDSFQEGIHKQQRIVSVQNELHDMILEIRNLGLKDANGEEVVQPTQVIVGISVQ